MIGTQISHYIIVEKLGDGGMGTVYKARDKRLLRHVAIKLLRPELMVDSKKRLRFIKEAQTASSLNHPNICTIHDINEDNDQHFIVMELVEGKTLREILEERKMLPESELVEIAVKICEALSAVHKKGISHRDIKPENIMITNNGLVKVMDFGLAKLATEYVESVAEMDGIDNWRKEYLDNVVTNLSGLLGTVHYMSPEQAQGEDVDQRSDIFSLGIMLYELLTGQKPFRGETNLDILTKIISETSDIVYPKNLVSPEFKSIISKALEKEAENRYQSVNEILENLNQIRPPGKPFSGSNKESETLRSKIRKRYAFLIPIILTSIVIVIAVQFFIVLPGKSKLDLSSMKTSRFTSIPGAELYPAFSPDGNSVAYTWNGPEQDNIDIYVKRKDGNNPVRLTTNSSPDFNPEWSGDGSYIAFARRFSEKSRTYDIFIIPSEGGQEQKVGTISPIGNVPNLSWSKDNKFIFFCQWAQQNKSVAVFKVSLETQNVEQVTSPPEEIVGDFSPRVSPDGKYVGFLRRKINDNEEICIQNLETKKVRQVTNENVRIQGFSWGQNSSIIFSANLDGSAALWKTSLNGKRKEKILSGISVNNPDYSPTGNSIVYNEFATKSNIWKMDLQHPENEVLLISSSTLENLNPNISPDGKRIVFSSNRRGTHNIWMSNNDGTEQTQLTFFDNQDKAGDAYWSLSNEEILLSFRGSHAYIKNLSTGQLKGLGDIGINPIWAQNGRDFYVSSYPETNLYFLSRDGKIRRQITNKFGLFAKQSDDYLYYFKHYGQREIWRVKIDGTHEEPILQNIKGIGIKDWDVTSKGIYFYRWEIDTKILYFYDFETGNIKEIRNIPSAVGSIEVDPNEQYLLYSKSEGGWSDLILVENVEIK